MFEPVPGRYVWNLSAGIALSVGGQIGEVDRACRPLVAAAGQSEDEATQAFFASWCGIADTLVELAQEDEKVGRRHSAAQKYLRVGLLPDGGTHAEQALRSPSGGLRQGPGLLHALSGAR